MCGFCGFTGSEFNNADNTVIGKMTERIAHRGPDGVGFHVTDAVSLGFRRLSFFDLENGSQPMNSADGVLTIVFNGEIYNHRELKAELEEKGRVFKTTSDTEVLLVLFEEYGEEMLNRLRGMFAFLIYNHETDELFAARDYFGIKPFYYGILNGQFLFASEIKAFLEYPAFVKKINPTALQHYLSFQYSVTDETFFAGIYKLPAAHYIKFKTGKADIKRYWQAEFKPDETLFIGEITDEIDAVVKNSVEYHQRADVTIGSLLSGGVDSSYVAAIADKVEKTFTVGFDYDGFSEIEHAKNLSAEKGVENVSKIITTEEFWEALPKIQYHMDEPLADPAAIALYFVCKLAREHVKGVLSGEGADELFGGYGIYREPLDLTPITRLPMPVRRTLGFLAKMFPFRVKGKNYLIRGSKTVEERFIGNANIFSHEEREQILHETNAPPPQEITRQYYEKAKHHDDITKMQYLDIHLWLVGDILLKADKMSMANSLESRVPFLDKEVFAVASKIPTRYRMNKQNGKFALRRAAKRNFKDKREKKRLGFPVPTRHWLREEKYYEIVRTALTQDFMAEFFKTEKLISLLERHKRGKEDNSRKIWTVFMFSVWYKEFFT
ncbi:MAG: asparagine synthase (glutamine-hydrolyzing) [Defluviitaleaceae bacterium]|nr:asparagine synthase (glutamine-hydrolyzing) [Defluviitaleaceae bacterium]MCL2224912.1 asparagine synthase (glutamine-hydrolyzing) [Defluviitaleaceae bacterium]MCL2262526.1 asparagine synthase (glutamine-hydrolyzing) [Defluviitaleaceae bacterium]